MVSKRILLGLLVVSCVSCGAAFGDWWFGNVDTNFYNGANYQLGVAPTSTMPINWSSAFATTGANPCVINGGTADSGDIFAYPETAAGLTASFTVTNHATYNIGSGSGGLAIGSAVTDANAIFTANGGSTVNVANIECGRNVSGIGHSTINVDGTGTTLNINGYMWLAHAGAPGPGRMNITNGAVVNVVLWHSLRLNDGGTNDGVINIAGGTLVLQGAEDRVGLWIDKGWLIAYNGAGAIKSSFDSVNNVTRVTALAPPVLPAHAGFVTGYWDDFESHAPDAYICGDPIVLQTPPIGVQFNPNQTYLFGSLVDCTHAKSGTQSLSLTRTATSGSVVSLSYNRP